MQIGLTKKLNDFVKRELSPVDINPDPFYSWTAGLGYLNRRKYIFVVNDATRCGFIIPTVKAKDIKELERLLVDGMREMLGTEFIAPKLVDRYLEDCGEIVYTKTAGRSEVARLNKFIDHAYCSLGLFSYTNSVNPTVLRSVNDDYVSKGGGELKYTRKLLYNEFINHYKIASPIQTEIAILEIKMELESECTRILAIPVNYSVYDLHMALQRLFMWQDYHLHKFCDYNQYDSNLVMDKNEENVEFDPEKEEELERQITILELINKSEKMTYYYDFGDGWETTIKLVRVDKNITDRVPKCIAAVGDAPPEDVGGPRGFAEIQRVLSNPQHNDYEQTLRWLTSMRWKPMDVKEIQEILNFYFL